MFSKYLTEALKLIDEGRPFVVALVVNHESPISGKSGDRAIVTADGNLWGWVAGGCSQSIIIEEALNVLQEGAPKMIRISPEPENSKDNVMKHKMTCHSGGTLDVYLEPVVPRPQVVILGNSAIAGKLVGLAQVLDYDVFTTHDAQKINSSGNVCAIVATQGDGDETALEQALSLKPVYLGFVASRKKAEVVKRILADRGISEKQLNAIIAPAGLDIKARSPEEIAISILAEIVMVLREKNTRVEQTPVSEKAIDPICGMTVKVEGARHTFEYQGTNYYFCCEGCKDIFSREPEKYLAEAD